MCNNNPSLELRHGNHVAYVSAQGSPLYLIASASHLESIEVLARDTQIGSMAAYISQISVLTPRVGVVGRERRWASALSALHSGKPIYNSRLELAIHKRERNAIDSHSV